MDRHLTPRLFVTAHLGTGTQIMASVGQSHYLQHVMRLKPGDGLRLFNGRDGEWAAEIATIGKKTVEIRATALLRRQQPEPNLWLCCAIIKKAHFEYMIEKATELGIAIIQPLLTARTQIRDINIDRITAIAVEAAEQSERLNIPVIKPALSLTDFIAAPPPELPLIVCAETGEAQPLRRVLEMQTAPGTAIVIGPEGGFAPEEFAALRHIKNAAFARLGPRILRADTAAIAALSCWQSVCGDWQTTEI